MVTREITESHLSRIGIQSPKRWVIPLNLAAKKYNCNSYDRWCAVISQMMHESGNFTRLRESLDYTPEGLLSTFRGRITPEQAARLGRVPGRPADQVAIANLVYGSRGGNSSTEGFKYRGAGLIQITFKNNYIKFEKESGLNGIVENPDIVATNLDIAAETGFWFFNTNQLWQHSTDVLKISSFVNTGRLDSSERIINGLEDRRKKFMLVRGVFMT
jgi:putative chitinase